MFTKVQLFNLAAGALLLKREISDADTDTSNEARVFRQYYDAALRKTLADLNLNSTAIYETLSLVDDEINDYWMYAYAYPTNCALIRRIQSEFRMDDRYTQIPFETGMFGTTTKEKVIYTNEEDAILEYIADDINPNTLIADAGLAIAHMLAWMSAPILVGKGADRVKKDLMERYLVHKAEAQEIDKLENPTLDDPATVSEFVKARTS